MTPIFFKILTTGTKGGIIPKSEEIPDVGTVVLNLGKIDAYFSGEVVTSSAVLDHRVWLGLHMVVMITSINLSQETFATDILTV